MNKHIACTFIALIVFCIPEVYAVGEMKSHSTSTYYNHDGTTNVTVNIVHHENATHHHSRKHHPRYHWVHASHGAIPPHAVEGGRLFGQPLYVCQGNYNNSVHPGKVINGHCSIPYGGSEINLSHYRVLVGHGLQWRSIPHRKIPYRGVVGGHEADGTPIYVCRVYHAGAYHPGKTYDGKCDISSGGLEFGQSDFETLISR